MDADNLNTRADVTGYINDYSEGRLEPSERVVFNNIMARNIDIASLAIKSFKGRRALRTAYTVVAADDFEEKLAKCIAREKQPEEGTAQTAI